MTDNYWFEDLNILLDTNKLDEFYPTPQMNYIRKVNSLVRGSIYVGIILAILYKNYLYIYIPLITMLITIILYHYRKINLETDNKLKTLNNKLNENLPINSNDINEHKNTENVNEKFINASNTFQEPNCNNPFMNAMPFDDRTRTNACSPLKSDNSGKIEVYFNKNLFREVGDIFNKQNGQREFYTMPSTTYPNKRDQYEQWLYGTPKTCKESNGVACINRNTERLNGQSYSYPRMY